MSSSWEMKSGNTAKNSSSNLNDIGNSMLSLFDVGLKSMRDISGILQNMSASKSSGNCNCCDEWSDCYPCGPLTSDTDLRIEGRMHERRFLSFIIENNKKDICEVKISVVTLFDACGRSYDASKNIIVVPSSLKIEPETCAKVRVGINFSAPLEEGQVYYAEFKIEGACCADNISLGIWVEPDNYADYLTYCDPCKPKLGKFVDFVNCECGGGSGSSCGCGCYSRSRSYYVFPESAQKTLDAQGIRDFDYLDKLRG
jgi:hypothetical protein